MADPLNLSQLAHQIKLWGQQLGFGQVGICSTDLSIEEPKLQQWLDKQYNGEMSWMSRHGLLRARPHELLPGTLRVISVRMNYLPKNAAFAYTLKNPQLGYISRYALGKDYHKILRKRLKNLGELIKNHCQQTIHFRPFVDSAPILERPLAANAGIGWVGKHSLLIHQQAGSWFFLGELLIDLPLPIDSPINEQCGRCVACIKICPTGAIIKPYMVDARRCISYLTIELEGVIPIEFRSLIGNRIYGCDDCQLICPWNRFAQLSAETHFNHREQLNSPKLLELYQWSESQFLKLTSGSAIRRIGYLRWLRNITVALGNAPYQIDILNRLRQKKGQSAILDEHIEWAIEQQILRRSSNMVDVQTMKKKRLIRIIEKGLARDA